MANLCGNSSHFGRFTGKGVGPDYGTESTSLVVLQFMEIVRLRVRLHAPGNPFRTASVTAERRYCLGCHGVRWHDVWRGEKAGAGWFESTRCRLCEKEGL